MKVLVLGNPNRTSKMYLDYLKTQDVDIVYKEIDELQGVKADVIIFDELVIEKDDNV